MKVISFINEKGGTCKTTFAVNFAAYYAIKRNKKVLLVDMDSQGHSGKSLGVHVHQVEQTIYDLMLDSRLDVKSAISETEHENLHLLCSNKNLSYLPEKLAGKNNRHLKLYNIVKKAEALGYDYVFIDSPPSVGLITNNILIASTDVVVPVALTYLALDGCAEVVGSIQHTRETVKEAECQLGMVIPTLYRNTKLANEIVKKLVEYFPDKISKTILGYNVKIDEAQSFGKTIWQYDENGKGSRMMEALAIELYNKVLRKK